MYLEQTIWPSDLAALYPFPSAMLPAWKLALEGLFLLGVTILSLRQARTRPYLLVGWFWYLITLAPVIGLLQVGMQSRADRYTYVPHFGLLIALVWSLWQLVPETRRVLVVGLIGSALCIPCVYLTRVQVGYWENSPTLWDHTLAVTGPDNIVAQMNYGHALQRAHQYDQAIVHLENAIRLDPQYETALAMLGAIYVERREYEKALPYLRAVLAINPENQHCRDLVKDLDEALEKNSNPP
jgi:tetratricopeptide (TPR) repeat protein